MLQIFRQKLSFLHCLNFLFRKLPDDDTGGDADIHGVLGTVLWYLQTAVAKVNDTLMDPFHLITEDNSVWGVTELRLMKFHASLHLFNGEDIISVFVKLVHGFLRRTEVSPCHTVLTTKGCLMNLGMGWGGGYAAKVYCLNPESVASTEYRANIIQRPHIVKHNDKGELLGFLKLVD